ncbi:DUF4255 domain-containing protein [Methyloterricola oryzae]|uniref:DUF4255 domain-containing protein n=1 Tax=Methyloterricola oryzae TaxID=1495050 RepID=UPI00069B3E66|nr:DUF4255 domain-containing protein [Methyloterricola oryzae]
MSNHLAIATVTYALKTQIANALTHDVGDFGYQVVTDRPDGTASGQAEVRLYLYQVTHNAAHRNDDLPTRRADGTSFVNRPQLALDLHYLISFFGKETELEPQRLLGSVARALHAHPVLSRDQIAKLIDPGTEPRVGPSWLAASDLDKQIELVRLTPLPLSLEELSKLWMVFFQTKYTLSVAYQASVVLLDADVQASEGPPVQERVVTAFPTPNFRRVTS